MKPQVFITDTGHQTENIVWLGGILGLFLLALLTLIRPGPTTGSVVMYYGLVVIVSLLLASVFRKNSFFREYVVDESQVVEITSFWKRMHWRKCYPRQDVSRVEVFSCHGGFPVGHTSHGITIRLEGKARLLAISDDRHKIERWSAQLNALLGKD